jgi:hypothetical protein
MKRIKILLGISRWATENLHGLLFDNAKNKTEILKINILTSTSYGLMVKISTDSSSVGSFPNSFYNNGSYENENTHYRING